MDLASLFESLTGKRPESLWQAPGRVNLIGEHTDYNDGFALPFAIDRQTLVAVRRRTDRHVRCWTAQLPASAGAAERPPPPAPAPLAERPPPAVPAPLAGRPPVLAEAHVDLAGLQPGAVVEWARYPLGVLWAFERAGIEVPGVDILIDSTVPVGAGLSSSAALVAAVAVAVDEICPAGLDRRTLAELCHQAESEFAGAPVGMLDHFAVLCAREGHGLLVDFRSLAVEQIPLGAGPLVVVDTGVRHRNADGAYAARRGECAQAAAQLGVRTLRDATLEDVETRLGGTLRRRARHVVSENARVIEVAALLRAGHDIGDRLYASHASLREDFEVSCPELDAVVETARQCGALGARLTGAGFGGSAIVLGAEAGEMAAALETNFRRAGFATPAVFTVVPSAGAGRLS